MSDEICLDHDERKLLDPQGYPYCLTCKRVERAEAEVRAEEQAIHAGDRKALNSQIDLKRSVIEGLHKRIEELESRPPGIGDGDIAALFKERDTLRSQLHSAQRLLRDWLVCDSPIQATIEFLASSIVNSKRYLAKPPPAPSSPCDCYRCQ